MFVFFRILTPENVARVCFVWRLKSNVVLWVITLSQNTAGMSLLFIPNCFSFGMP